MKDECASDLFLYRSLTTLDRDLARYDRWFNRERPHEGLKLRTPDQVYIGRKPRPMARMENSELTRQFMDGDRRLPILRLKRVA